MLCRRTEETTVDAKNNMVASGRSSPCLDAKLVPAGGAACDSNALADSDG